MLGGRKQGGVKGYSGKFMRRRTEWKRGANEFFNVAVERLIASGTPVRFTTTRGLPWAEVDDPDDLRYAQTRVYPRLVAELRGWKGLALSEDALIPAVHS